MPFFEGPRGRIYHDSWLPEGDARAAVVLTHGYGEHLGLYDALARRLVDEGLAVHALDSIGHGRSDGERAVVDTWDDHVADVHELADWVDARYPGRPVVLLGHSSGAVTVTLLALRYPEVADALVLSGAPLRPLPWVEAELEAGHAETEGGDPTEALSTHPDYVHALLHDPLTWKGGFRRETLLALRGTWPELEQGLAQGRPDVPVLLVHGGADPVVPLDFAYEVAGQLPNAQVQAFPGDLHDVLNEHDRDAVHASVAAFLGELLAGSRAESGGA